jgi:Ser-tRNA(Ala) deacylase AlaX
LYHAFCGFLSETANSFDAEVEYRKFEVKLFGESGGTDSLRAAHLETDVTEAFRNLMNVIRQNIQVRLNKLSKEDVQSRLKEVENKNRMLEQQIKQVRY